MAQRDLVAGPEQGRECGAHAFRRRVGLRDQPQLGVGLRDRVGQRLEHVDAGSVGIERGKGRDRDCARYLPGRVPAHPVSDGEQVRPGISGVLVALAEQAHI